MSDEAGAVVDTATPETADTPAPEAPASDESGGFLSEDQPSGTPSGTDEPGGGFLADGNDGQAVPEGYIKLPGEDASDEDRAAFAKAMGVPDSAEGYDITLPEEFTEGRDDYVGSIRDIAHAVGLSPAQAQKLAEYDYNAKVEAGVAAEENRKTFLQQQAKDTKAALEKEHGDKTAEVVRVANRSLHHFGGKELVNVLAEAGVLNEIAVLNAFHKAGLSLVEDSSPDGGTGAAKKSHADILFPDIK